eukprot:1659503-Pyramimonas_sp.AAC.1
MLRPMGNGNPTWGRVRFVRAARAGADDPGPWLKMPLTYFLDEPGQYFMTDMKARHRNKLQRSQWQTAFRSNAAQPALPAHPTGRPGAGAGQPAQTGRPKAGAGG